MQFLGNSGEIPIKFFLNSFNEPTSGPRRLSDGIREVRDLVQRVDVGHAVPKEVVRTNFLPQVAAGRFPVGLDLSGYGIGSWDSQERGYGILIGSWDANGILS
jgi:hypothetical protein